MATKKQQAEDAKNRRMRAVLDVLPVAPKRGRPVTTGTTPPAQRAAKSRAARAEAGGQRLNINLTPQAAEDLAAIQADNPGLTRTEAVHAALYAYRRNL